ncbi:MAG: cytochrome c biogenesis protein CcsA [Saprospiraceae bacterium]
MEEIQYIGEHLLPGQMGHFAIILGFVSGLLAAVSYFFATQRRALPESSRWRQMGRGAFILHGISIFTIIGTMFWVMLQRYFEYQYVWQHVSEDLPFRYIFSAFWEGQEGSFLLWMFWHVVLGFILLARAKKWETPVMSVLSFVQVFIISMILGIYLTNEVKIGSNPLLLLRDTMDIPLFNNAGYVQLIQGNGLNPLLQNYWMTIHPPTLFLGFASTVVPFSYAIAGLWTREHKAWLRPALPWVLFSGAILGLGILMGGAWAYEALSFGGYWAWDPVENMSLVPWITLLAGLHAHLVARSTGYSLKSSYLLYIITFLLVLYSTFLTRSGILGESSVHAFTEMGLETQLVLFILVFLGIGAWLMFSRRKEIPVHEKEEPLASREFWMFIGSLVLLFSAVIITGSTSLPVYNKIVEIFKPGYEGLTITDPITHYNKYQLWIAVFTGLLTGAGQFLRYKESNWPSRAGRIFRHLAFSGALALLLAVGISFWLKAGAWQFWVLMISGLFAVVANVTYLVTFLKGNLKFAGPVISHAGFGIMIVGIIGSGLNKKHISSNPMVQRDLLSEDMLQKNVLLFKNTPMYMSGYRVTYERDTLVGNLRKFLVHYEKLDDEGNVVEDFHVEPTATYDNKVTEVKAFNPSTKRYLGKDIFTHISTLPMREANFKFAREQDDSMEYQTYLLSQNEKTLILDTVENKQGGITVFRNYARMVSIDREATHPDYHPQKGDVSFGVNVAFETGDTVFYAKPIIVLRGEYLYTYPVQLNDLSFKVRLTDKTLKKLYVPEEELGYKEFKFRKNDKITLNGLEITFTGFNRAPSHPAYVVEEGDVAVNARLEVRDDKTGETYEAQPLFLIRGQATDNFKDEIEDLGLHFRFVGIDPVKEQITVLIAQHKPDWKDVPVQIAKKSFRSDYIVIEAIVFPGINLFWLGSTLMMIGLAVAMFRRRKEKQRE